MPVENQEQRTVEVLGLPEGVEEELLCLYFENKRRSGGGPLISVEKQGDRALLVFEEAQAAAAVLSKGHHVLHNAELTVRKPASKDHCRLLLRGINPNTEIELIELYVENNMGLDQDDYTLHPSPRGDLILIHFHQPFSKDFQTLTAKISSKTLEGSKITLEQIEQTDSILVENLHPGITRDMLTLYFESKRGGNQKVKEVIMISESAARVSFVEFESVVPVVNLLHKLEDADLTVKPYFDFLQPTESVTSQNSETGCLDSSTDSSPPDLSHNQIQTSSPTAVAASSQSSHQTALEPVAAHRAVEEVAEEVMEDLTEEIEILSSHIAITDPVKCALLQLSTLPRDIQQAHPNFDIQVKDDGVHIAGPDKLGVEQLKNTILEFLGSIAQTHLTFDPEKVQFLANKDVKERLLQTMNQLGMPTLYTVSDCVVVLTSLSRNSVSQACSYLKSQLSDFSIPVNQEYECMLYIKEWSEFLQALGFSSVRVSETGGKIDVLTLKGMESEKQTKILEFLSTPIERETVISMEPGMLKYIQIHCHQLLADMHQVSIFPLEGAEVCGLKIHGNAPACQMADEVLQGVVSSICTRTITINAPGVARFLLGEECKSILKEMQTKFQVYINLDKVHWEPLQNEDIFEAAWKMMSHQNFQQVSLDGSAQDLIQTDQNFNHSGAPDRGLLEEAKRIVSVIDEEMEVTQSSSDKPIDVEEEDLYTAEEPTSLTDQDTDVVVVDAPQALRPVTSSFVLPSDEALGLPSDLEEEAQLSLAIQYSMESTKRSFADEEEELQKVLELSKKMVQHEGSSDRSDESSQLVQLDKGIHTSLQDAIKAANTIQIFVFAGYTCDLIRVDIALGKKVTLRQVEEKLEHRSLKRISEFHKRCMEMIKRKHAVEIQIQGTIVTISGFKDYVAEALHDMNRLLEKMAKTPSDSEILRTIQWVQHDPASSATTPYPPDVIVFIENAWKMKQKKIDILLNNQPHIINFEKMQEYNIASGKSVKISRKMLSSQDLNADVSEEEYSLLSNLPQASKVDEDSDEFQDVVKNFYDSIQEYHSKIRIIQVEKLMNRLLYNQYRLKKASILQSATYPEVERTLYHGTSETSVKEICIHGFNRSFCGKNATVYGQGVYFAVNSALSVQEQYSPPNADGHKFVFVSKVLTGDYTKGCHSMKTAPLKESADMPLRYDSVTDSITKPSLFVIFNDTQAFPEYLITCQRIHR
ncbi:protein mono-ADP-ribosyltransferase PARP10 [Centroberyx gerrardi]|uniref:protein mono-ADP-ribosyltransferase PARP10 n=1 Tax=Centroberyx gerrardi TaxID=166262 RepID=UPI003AAC9752